MVRQRDIPRERHLTPAVLRALGIPAGASAGSPISALFISNHKHELPYRGEPQAGEAEVSLV
jgi:hypothetical protein